MFALAQAAIKTLMDSMAQRTDIYFITEAGSPRCGFQPGWLAGMESAITAL